MRGAAQPAVLKKPGSHAGSADSSTTSCEVRLSASSAVVRVGRDCVTAGNKLGAVRQRSEVECRASLACQPFRGRRQCGRALSLQLRGRAVGPVQLACRMLVEGRLCKRFISSEAPSAAHVSPHCKGHRMSGAHGDGHDPRFACQGAGASKLWCRLQTAARSDLYHSTARPALPSGSGTHRAASPAPHCGSASSPCSRTSLLPPAPRQRPSRESMLLAPTMPPLRAGPLVRGACMYRRPRPQMCGGACPSPGCAPLTPAAAGMRGAAAALDAGLESGPGPCALPEPPASAAARAPAPCSPGAEPASAPAGSAPWAAGGEPAAPPGARYRAASASTRPCRYAARPGSCASSGLPPVPPPPAPSRTSHSSTGMTCARAHAARARSRTAEQRLLHLGAGRRVVVCAGTGGRAARRVRAQ
jgi:hypothetical protein